MVEREQVKPGVKVRVLQNSNSAWHPNQKRLLGPGDIVTLNGDISQYNSTSYLRYRYAVGKATNVLKPEDIELVDEPDRAILSADQVCTCNVWVAGCTCGVFAAEMKRKSET